MRKKITAWLDKNEDGELTIDDIAYMSGFGHEWMLLAGVSIAIGSLGNVFGYWSIDSDFFWFCAAIAAMSEYIDDLRKKQR
tara:strand:- start:1942 stop:2184 length:243 start_codon:yes stop_codon:yes gene_type:complete